MWVTAGVPLPAAMWFLLRLPYDDVAESLEDTDIAKYLTNV